MHYSLLHGQLATSNRNRLTYMLCRFFFATLLSVYNKWMFSSTHFGFPAPVLVTAVHMVVQFCLAAMLRAFWPKRFRPPQNPTPGDYVCVVYAYVDLPNLVLSESIGKRQFQPPWLPVLTLAYQTCLSKRLLYHFTVGFICPSYKSH